MSECSGASEMGAELHAVSASQPQSPPTMQFVLDDPEIVSVF